MRSRPSARLPRTPTRRASSAPRPPTPSRRSVGRRSNSTCLASGGRKPPVLLCAQASAKQNRGLTPPARLRTETPHRFEVLPMLPLNRRSFLAASSTLLATGGLRPPLRGDETPRSRPPKRAKPAAKKIALVTSAYYYLSHAYHIGGRFLDGYMKGDEHHFPDFGIASP